MKKFISLIIVLICVLMFTACDNGSASKATDNAESSSPEDVLKLMYSSLERVCLSDPNSDEFDKSFDDYYNSSYCLAFNQETSKDTIKEKLRSDVGEFAYETVVFDVSIKEQRAGTKEELNKTLTNLKEMKVDTSDTTEAYVLVYDLKSKYGTKKDGIEEESEKDVPAVMLKRDGKWYCDYDYLSLFTSYQHQAAANNSVITVN